MRVRVGFAATILVSAALVLAHGETRPTLVVASFGGEWQAAQRAAMFEPFAEEHGVEIVEVEYDGDYSLLREKGRNGEWDVVDVESSELLRGAEEGIFEPIDYARIDREALIPAAVHEFGAGLMTYSIVLGFNSDAFSESHRPTDWSAFWDTERFPGKRGLRQHPEWMLEIALLAGGVPPEKLYPLDMDRAFEMLESIEDDLVIFEQWSQPARMLERGDVTMSAGTNGRLLAAREAGAPVEISWEQGILSLDYFVIPRGSRNVELAQELVAFAVGIEAQKEFPLRIDYGPTNRDALEFIPPERRARLPSAREESQVVFDAGWWLRNEDEAVRRYREIVSSE